MSINNRRLCRSEAVVVANQRQDERFRNDPEIIVVGLTAGLPDGLFSDQKSLFGYI
jgi:hypothetical protein